MDLITDKVNEAAKQYELSIIKYHDMCREI